MCNIACERAGHCKLAIDVFEAKLWKYEIDWTIERHNQKTKHSTSTTIDSV